MSIAARSAVHRDDLAAGSWLSVASPAEAAPGRHRRAGRRLEDDGSVALLRRAVGAGAVWLVAFGLFSMAEGWTQAGAFALVIGVLMALCVSASLLLGTLPDPAPDPMIARSRGVNFRRNGYRSMT